MVCIGRKHTVPLANCAFKVLDFESHEPQFMPGIDQRRVQRDGAGKVIDCCSRIALTGMEFTPHQVGFWCVGAFHNAVVEPSEGIHNLAFTRARITGIALAATGESHGNETG